MALDIQLYSRAARPTTAEERAVGELRSRLDKFSRHLRHVGVRFDRATSPRGNVDKTCRVDVTLVSVFDAPKLLVEGRARSEQEAADIAADAVEGAVRREVEEVESRLKKKQRRKVERTSGKQASVRREESATTKATEEEVVDVESNRITPRAVKTAHPRRKRHIHKTQRQARATSAIEFSATRPSRKSTRKSANRSKRDSNLARSTKRSVRSPKARATKAQTARAA